MAEETVGGLVLRRKDRGESDRVLTLLTQERGKIYAVAKGARKSGSRLAAAAEPLMLGRFHVAVGRSQTFITQVEPVTSFPNYRTDYDRLSLAIATCEMADAIAPLNQPDEPLFHSVVLALSTLHSHENLPLAALWGWLQILEAEGVTPQWITSAVSGEPLRSNPAWFSFTAGGLVDGIEAMDYTDARRVPAEALIGLEKLQALPEPPPKMKFLAEALRVTRDYILHVARTSLPALESAVDEIERKN